MIKILLDIDVPGKSPGCRPRIRRDLRVYGQDDYMTERCGQRWLTHVIVLYRRLESALAMLTIHSPPLSAPSPSSSLLSVVDIRHCTRP